MRPWLRLPYIHFSEVQSQGAWEHCAGIWAHWYGVVCYHVLHDLACFVAFVLCDCVVPVPAVHDNHVILVLSMILEMWNGVKCLFFRFLHVGQIGALGPVAGGAGPLRSGNCGAGGRTGDRTGDRTGSRTGGRARARGRSGCASP